MWWEDRNSGSGQTWGGATRELLLTTANAAIKHMSMYVSFIVYLSTDIFTYLSIYISTDLSSYLSTSLPIHLSLCIGVWRDQSAAVCRSGFSVSLQTSVYCGEWSRGFADSAQPHRTNILCCRTMGWTDDWWIDPAAHGEILM